MLPELLERIGSEACRKLIVKRPVILQHNPEPLERTWGTVMGLMAKGGCDVAFVVDPDVDRLANDL